MTLPTRICHITSVHPYWDSRILHKECVTLARAGYEVRLIVIDQSSGEHEGVEVINIDLGVKNRFDRIRRAPAALYKRVREMEDVDIVHFHDPELLRIGKRLKQLGKKVIYDAHEDLPRQMLGKPYLPAFVKKPLAWLVEQYEDRIARSLDAVVVPTPFIRERFLKVHSNTVEVRNTPKLEEIPFSSFEERDGSQICYVGKLTAQRGVDRLVQAMGGSEGTTLHLVGPLEEGFRKVLERYEGWERVKLWGLQERKGVLEALSRSSLGVVLLQPAVNYLTALPVKMFEYMAAGLPVLSSDFPDWKKIVEEEDCGICVDPTDPARIAEGIREILADRDRMETMGKNGRLAVERAYNWDREAERLLSLYEHL